jgi:Fe-S cluster assembly scaffold protein SufB
MPEAASRAICTRVMRGSLRLFLTKSWNMEPRAQYSTTKAKHAALLVSDHSS